MKIFKPLFIVLICLIFAIPSSAGIINDTTKLKVLSYNLRFGELASLKEMAEFIKEVDPDIVALQEVDSRTFRDRAPEQNDKDFATELAFYTGMFPAYGKTIPYKKGYYGIAILSKYPLAKIQREYLPKTEYGEEQRAVLIADVEYDENKYFTFASTHLDYTNTTERQIQVKKLNELLLDREYPVIVGGDFNAYPDSKEIDEGMADWLRVSEIEPTVPTEQPKNTIDYIFCYPEENFKRINAETHTDIKLSDHLPISVEVEMITE